MQLNRRMTHVAGVLLVEKPRFKKSNGMIKAGRASLAVMVVRLKLKPLRMQSKLTHHWIIHAMMNLTNQNWTMNGIRCEYHLMIRWDILEMVSCSWSDVAHWQVPLTFHCWRSVGRHLISMRLPKFASIHSAINKWLVWLTSTMKSTGRGSTLPGMKRKVA